MKHNQWNKHAMNVCKHNICISLECKFCLKNKSNVVEKCTSSHVNLSLAVYPAIF